MQSPITEDGLHIAGEDEIDLDNDALDPDALDPDERHAEERTWSDADADGELESLRAAFVDAFNSRDLEDLLGIVAADVEVPDLPGEDGAGALAMELERMWANAPALLLTRAFLDGRPCAVAWLPDEEDCWSRVALVCFEHDGDKLTLVAVPDDVDAMERAEAEAPDGDELDEWSDWSEWETGEETHLRVRLNA
ncbi:MAG TPA: hypothetical protein VNU01_01910 [Egibacteraceae bacterium]|nr:hypothetical protein [Egibacteraceae bacterium]